MSNQDPKYRTRKRTEENSLFSIYKAIQNLVHSQHVWLIFTVLPRWSRLNKGQIGKKKEKKKYYENFFSESFKQCSFQGLLF